MLATDIAEYLEDQSIGTVGTDIFVGQMPDTTSNAIAIYEYAGTPPECVGHVENPRLVVRVRNTIYANARSKARDILYALHTKADSTIESHSYLYIRAVGSINYLGRDAENRVLFSIDFLASKIMESA
jgi:hypothetical protein